MKKIFTLAIMMGLMLPFLTAQDARHIELNNTTNFAKQKILEIMKGNQLIDDFVICQEMFEWDTLENQFKEIGDGTISYEEMGNQKKITILAKTYAEEEESDIKVEIFLSFQVIAQFQGDLAPDSLLIYTGDGMGNYLLFTKDINFFENEMLVLSKSFTDYSLFGLPLGYIQSGETRYYYDGNDLLVADATDNFSFVTNTLEFADSTVYENNSDGLPVVETGYQVDLFSQQITPYYQTDYTYVNQFFVETEIEKAYFLNEFVVTGRNSYEYDGMNRETLSLSENSEDGGMNWEFDRREQSMYEDDLPFEFPSRTLQQDFIDGSWRNESLTANEDCTSNNETTIVETIDMWFDEDVLYLKHDIPGQGTINIYDLNGRTVHKSFHANVPSSILLSELNRGIYIVQIDGNTSRYTQKVFK